MIETYCITYFWKCREGQIALSPSHLVGCGLDRSRTVRDCCWPWGISNLIRAAAPRPSPEEKRAWNQM